MKNKFGVELDENGYAPSVITDKEVCFNCGRSGELVRHEVYHGLANRTKSKNLGCWVPLCPACHDLCHGKKQKGKNLDIFLKNNCYGLICWHYGWNADDFRKEFGKSYDVL